ncbi:type II secretion system protein GspD [Desulfovibrio sp. JC022]|nr:type II secretion system protein GspD [Desulfovibrio sp. JC022]
MRNIFIYIVACFIFLAPVSANMNVHSARAAGGTISLDFKAVDIHILIKFISEITGKNFIVDKNVGGRVTIYSPTKISVDEAYKVFESVLQLNGFVIIPSGNTYKILPAARGQNLAVPTNVGGRGMDGRSDELITQIIPLKNSSVTELGTIVQTMLGPTGGVSMYKPSNTLIVTTLASNLKRILKIVHEVDRRQYATRSENIVIKFGDAETISESINKIMTAKLADMEKKGRQGIALTIADERTNSIYVLADAANLTNIKSMISSMDLPTPEGKGGIHLYNLHNANSEDLAKVLTELVSGASAAKDAKDKVVKGKVKIVADKATNSLVITARPDDYTHLEKIIKKMDVRRKQVFIEALIMEVSDDADFEFGANWVIPAAGGDTMVFGSASTGSTGTISLSDGMAAFPPGGAIGALFSDVFKVGGTEYSVQSLISASESNDDFSILSTPQLMTLDNQEATVNVVDNIPFSTKTTTNNVDSDYESQNLEYKDVGVKLKVTPHIGQDDDLQLNVFQEVSRVVPSTVSSNIIAPTTRKREVETVIQVKDGQTIVIAGLLGEDDTINESKVPLLGDIPGLGYLFRYEKKEKVKTNLFVFLTPKIMDSVEEEDQLYKEKRQKMYDIEVGADGLGKVRTGLPVMPEILF